MKQWVTTLQAQGFPLESIATALRATADTIDTVRSPITANTLKNTFPNQEQVAELARPVDRWVERMNQAFTEYHQTHSFTVLSDLGTVQSREFADTTKRISIEPNYLPTRHLDPLIKFQEDEGRYLLVDRRYLTPVGYYTYAYSSDINTLLSFYDVDLDGRPVSINSLDDFKRYDNQRFIVTGLTRPAQVRLEGNGQMRVAQRGQLTIERIR